MKKFFIKISLLAMALILILAIVPVVSFAGSSCNVNAAYSRVDCNADDGSMPTSVKTFYYGDTTYINLQCGSNIYMRSMTYHLAKDGVSDYKTNTIYPEKDFYRFCSAGWDRLPVGSYTLYWTITASSPSYSSSISTYNSPSYSFSVIDRTPSLNASSNSVSLNLAGTKSKTINIWASCDLSYSSAYKWEKDTSAISCKWGNWTSDGKLPLTITGNDACSNEPVTIKLLKSSDDTVVATKTIYVTVTKPSYTVSYNSNGGTGAPSNQTKYYNDSLTLSSTVPTRTGYNFAGWGTSSGSSSAAYQPGGSYTSNSGATLYAVWQQKTLSSGSNGYAEIKRGGQEYFMKFTPSTSQKYVFYSTGGSDTKGALYDSAGNLIVNDDDGGEGTNFRIERYLSSGSTYYYGIKYYGSSSTGSISVGFGPIYTISYNANGGSGAPSNQEKDWGKDTTLSSTAPTRNGYYFQGWSTSSNATTATYSAGSSISVNGNTTLYAVWKEKPTYVVKYNANGGAVSPSSVNVMEGNSTTLPTPIKKYKITYNANNGTGAPTAHEVSVACKGWSTSNLATSATYNCGGQFSPSTNVNLYAVWNSSASTTVSTTKPTRNGYNFQGWSTSSNATTATYSAGSSISVNGNTTLYAVWKEHAHEYRTKTVSATCSSQGYTIYSCTKCSHSYKSNYTAKLPHKFDDWSIVEAPTDTANGTGERTCSVCGASENIELAYKEDKESKVQLMFPYKPNTTIVVKDETQTIGNLVQNGLKTHKLYDITMLKDNKPVQPDGTVTVRIPVPNDFDRSRARVYHIKSRNPIVREEIPSDIDGDFIVFKTNHFSYFEVAEETGKVNSVSISDTALNYKGTTTIKPQIKAESNAKCTIKYSSSNPSVARVDENGNVYAAGTGTATITCTVTDLYGNTVKDTCTVRVNYSWWQWIIIIVLFGWLWY